MRDRCEEGWRKGELERERRREREEERERGEGKTLPFPRMN